MTDSCLIFEEPQKKHANILHELNTTFQPYADTAYGTFLTWWNLYDDLSFGILNENIVVRSSYPTLGKNITYSIVGGHKVEATFDQVFDDCLSQGLEAVIHSATSYQVDELAHRRDIQVTHEPGIAEYVLSAEQHAQLDTKEFLKIRHKVSHFENVYNKALIECREVDLHDKNSVELITSSLDQWSGLHKNDKDQLESNIISKSLLIHATIELRCFAVFVNKRPVGFALYKYLPRQYINLNHLKVNYEYKDVFTYVLHRLAKHLIAQGVTHINIEQDLDIEGLRIFKQRLRPIEMLDKYTARRI